LIIASVNGHEACVHALIAANSKVAALDFYGSTALHLAAENGHSSVCRVLIDEGASLLAVDRSHRTPLEIIKATGNTECLAVFEAPTAAEKAKVSYNDIEKSVCWLLARY